MKAAKKHRNIPSKEQHGELTARHSFQLPNEQWYLCFFVQASLQHPRLAAEVIHMHVIHNSSPGFMVPSSLKKQHSEQDLQTAMVMMLASKNITSAPPSY